MVEAPPLEPYRAEIAHEAQQYQDREQARALWVAVLGKAQHDIGFLRGYSARDDLGHHERIKQRNILRACPGEFPEGSTDPYEFIESEWFIEVCRFVGLEPVATRATLKGEG